MTACTALPQGAGFVSSLTGAIDCQAEMLGTGAWNALAAPGSTLAIILTGFLTMVIALIGYNLLLGRTMSVRDGTLAFVKIGAVFALATSWPAYRTLIYDVVTDGPGQLVAEIGPSAAVVGSDGTLVQRLDLADGALSQLALLGAGTPPPGAVVQAPPPFGGFDAFALGGSRILFLLTAVGGIAAVRIVTGLMLALGPFFIAFLMFDATRSLFEGWVRVLGGAALAAVGVAIALGLELALLEPWISGVLARRMAGEALPSVPAELFVFVTLFTMLVVASLYACLRVIRAFHLGLPLRVAGAVSAPSRARSEAGERSRPGASASEVERTRAAAIAGVLLSRSQREGGGSERTAPVTAATSGASFAERRTEPVHETRSVGRTFARRSASRVSARATRRDMSA